MSRFNTAQPESPQSYRPSFNTGGGCSELEIGSAEETRIAILVASACRRCANVAPPEHRQDVAQEAAMNIMKRIREGLVLSDEDVDRYAYIAAQRAWLMTQRTERRRAHTEAVHEHGRIADPPQWHHATTRAEAYTVSRAYENLAGRMPDAWRQAFELIQLQGHSYQEVSARLDVSVTALRKRVTKAQEYLKSFFGSTRPGVAP
jgi:RNA polymerase sigma factor (sigma-70 family)